MRSIAKAERGAILYLRQEGRGIGLLDKLRAYNLQDEGFDTVDANILLGHPPDLRDYRVAAAIMRDLGIKSAHLLTNNPEKVDGLRSEGIAITERTALPPMVTEENLSYLETKQQRMNHLLSLDDHSQEPPPDSTER
jgi:3,4-dihydroxy 2-butanone 4-phosphate synthase/GTP cyclohydrolase II